MVPPMPMLHKPVILLGCIYPGRLVWQVPKGCARLSPRSFSYVPYTYETIQRSRLFIACSPRVFPTPSSHQRYRPAAVRHLWLAHLHGQLRRRTQMLVSVNPRRNSTPAVEVGVLNGHCYARQRCGTCSVGSSLQPERRPFSLIEQLCP
jgi:hypothetical protein